MLTKDRWRRIQDGFPFLSFDPERDSLTRFVKALVVWHRNRGRRAAR